MSGRFDKFFDYAYEKGRDIAKKFHGIGNEHRII